MTSTVKTQASTGTDRKPRQLLPAEVEAMERFFALSPKERSGDPTPLQRRMQAEQHIVIARRPA